MFLVLSGLPSDLSPRASNVPLHYLAAIAAASSLGALVSVAAGGTGSVAVGALPGVGSATLVLSTPDSVVTGAAPK